MVARLLVLALGQRVDRPDLAAAPLQPLQAAVDLRPLLLAQRRLGCADLLTELGGDLGQLALGLGAAVAEMGGLDLRLG